MYSIFYRRKECKFANANLSTWSFSWIVARVVVKDVFVFIAYVVPRKAFP